MDQLMSIWNEVLAVMATEVAKTSFDTWLKDTKPNRLEGNVLYIGVPNEFTRDLGWALHTRSAQNIASHSQRGSRASF